MIRKINNTNVGNLDYGNALVSHTGNTTETKLMSVLIPGNTFRAGDLIDIEAILYKIGTASSYTYKFYWNTSDTISGATQIAVRGIGSTAQYATGSRRLSVRTANGTGSAPEVGTEVIVAGTGLFSEYQSNTISNLALNWTVDSYLMTSILLGNAADNVVQYSFKIWTY